MKVNSVRTSIIAMLVVPLVFFFGSFLLFPDFSKQFFGFSFKEPKKNTKPSNSISKNNNTNQDIYSLFNKIENSSPELTEGIKNTTNQIQNINKIVGVEDRLKNLFSKDKNSNTRWKNY